MFKDKHSSSGDSPKEFQPYIPADKIVPEMTVRAVVLGSLLGIVFGAANAYLGMKIGMTISASIPAAVMSMAILRGVMRRGTILENNMVQTIASSGESLAAGVIFTIPGFLVLRYLLRWDGVPEASLPHLPSMTLTFLMTLIGGFIGALMMIPLRRYLIVKEHGVLPFPEGTACAQVLEAGEEGGVRAKHVFTGIGIGGVYMLLMKGLKLWKDEAMWIIPRFNKGGIGVEPSAALLGVGFIIGPKIAAYMFAGGVLGWLVLIPLLGMVGSYDPSLIIPPATKPLAELNSWQIASSYVRYMGAGAVALGGIVSLIKAMPVIISSFGHSLRGLRSRMKEGGKGGEPRTDQDLPMTVVFGGSFLLAISIGFILYVIGKGVGLPNVGTMSAAGGFVAILFSFFFITVAARIVGIVGSSSSPVSGMTITSLLAVCLTLVGSGLVTKETSVGAMVIALAAGAIICISVCSSGDISQDLKTGYLVGSTPWRQQIAELIAVIVPSISIVGTIYLLLLRGGGLNTLPVYEGRLNFENDPIVEEVYQGKLGSDAQNLEKVMVKVRAGGENKPVEALAFDKDGQRYLTALDAVTLGGSGSAARPRRRRGRRVPSAQGRVVEGKLLSKGPEGLKFLALDGRLVAARPNEVTGLSRGVRITALADGDKTALDNDGHVLIFESASYGRIPVGLSLVILPDQTALEGKVFGRGKTEKGEWILFRSVEGEVRRLEPGQYERVISYDDKMGELRAPQANIMAILIKGIIDGKLPWALVFIGALIAGVIELLGISSLPFAIGLYLGIATNAAIMVGGVLFWICKKILSAARWEEAEQKGTLLASGIIAGDALMGILLAFLSMSAWTGHMALREPAEHLWEDGLTLAVFMGLTLLLGKLILKKDKGRAAL